MNIDLTPLIYGHENQIIIKEKVTFSKEDLKNTELIDIKNVEVEGQISKNSEDINIWLNIKGKMILPCSRTLKPTDYEFETQIDENIDENEEKFKKNQKTIDILPIIWENILMEIPIRVINPSAEEIKTKGDGWELITDSEIKGHNSLAKLKDLL